MSAGRTARLPGTFVPLLIADGIRASAVRAPRKPALAESGRELTYAELVERIDRVATAAVHGAGLRHGDRAAIVAPNCLEYMEIVCGVAAAGCAVATVNARSSVREVAEILGDAGARLCFVHPALEEVVHAAQVPSLERIVVLGDDYERWLASARPARPETVVDEWEPFCIPYTSGTTGRPKGVLLPHRARAHLFFAMAVEFGCYSVDDRALGLAPMYHGAGFAFAAAPVFFGGFCEILTRFEPELLLRALAEGGMTNVFMVPSHFHALFALEESTLRRFRPSLLRTIISNAAPLPQATKERIVDYFGDGVLHECYGSTEAGITSNLRPVDQLRKRQCVGHPFPCTEVRLLDDDGREVPAETVGELHTRSPFMFAGYWGRPEATAASMRDGWFSAGDLARRDEEGYLYIVDRKDDKIVSGGVNIYPREIEEAIARPPAVREVAVFGIPDDYFGEAVCAAVVLAPGATADAEQIVAACGELGRYKRPRRVDFCDALPHNAAGKVLRRGLRDPYWAGRERNV
jgi:long-chain acyl-CoA synthetase